MLKQKALKNAFSKRLLDLMKEEDITQKELADGIGTSQQAIQQYIKGAASPKMEMFVEIADFLKVSCDYLLGRTDTKTTDVEVQAVVNKYGLEEGSLETLEAFMAPYPSSEDACAAMFVETVGIEFYVGEDQECKRDIAESRRDALKALNALLFDFEFARAIFKYIHDILFETLGDTDGTLHISKKLRLTEDEFRRKMVFLLLNDVLERFREEVLSDSKDNTKNPKKTTTKKKRATKGDC
jgi:transcriptional regulator with XRE-family HTH domain